MKNGYSNGSESLVAEARELYEVYEIKRRRGEDVSILHEELLPVMADAYGQPTADYFDRKQALPYVTRKWLPWPVKASSYLLVEILRYGLSFAVAVAVLNVVVDLEVTVRLIAGVIAFAVVFFGLFPLLGLFPFVGPKDVAQREADMQEFEELKQAHKTAQRHAASAAREGRLGNPPTR